MPTLFSRRSCHRRYRPGRGFLEAVIWLLSVVGAEAQTVITSEWNTSSGNWNVPANWAPADVPDNDQFADYDVFIGNRAVAHNARVDLILEDGTLDAVNNLTLSNGAAFFTSGQFLFVNGQTFISDVSTQLRVDPQSGGTTAFRTSTLVINNGTSAFISGGLMEVASSMTINAGGTLTGFGTVTFGDNDATVETALNNSDTIKMSAGVNPVLTLQRMGVDTLDLDGTSEAGVLDVANTSSDVANDTLTMVINSPLTDAFSGTIQVGRRDTITFNNNFTMNGAEVDMDGDGFTATMNGTGNVTSIVNSVFNLEEDVATDLQLTFGNGNTINLNRASWRLPSDSLTIHGALNVLAAGGQESSMSVSSSRNVTFDFDSVTTLNSNLLIQSRAALIVKGATFSGLGALRIGGHPLGTTTTRSSVLAVDGANINVQVVNEGDFIVTGFNAPGRNDVKAFQQTATGSLGVDIAGAAPSQFDRLIVSGATQLAGNVDVHRDPTFTLVAGQTFDIIVASGGVTGQFDTVTTASMPAGLTIQVNYFPQSVQLVVVAAPPSPTPTATPTPTAAPPTVLGNISTRLRVETGNNVLIGGFIITGTQSKKVIVRAIGPSLSQFFAGTLANPTLELRDQQGGLIAANDDWKLQPDPDRQAVIDSTVAPTNDLESALVRTLPANGASYTAIVSGANNGTGIGVVEAFDLDQSVDSKLANISTRGFVQTDPDILIAGTIVVGSQAQKVLIRAIGPSLSQFFSGTLANPTLELRDQNGGLLAANDDWKNQPDADRQAVIDSTIPPTNDLESALVRTLPANNAQYTAIVRGVNGGTGIAVVEVYALN
jgi:hypothetical protein